MQYFEIINTSNCFENLVNGIQIMNIMKATGYKTRNMVDSPHSNCLDTSYTWDVL